MPDSRRACTSATASRPAGWRCGCGARSPRAARAQQARRAVHAAPPQDAVTTLLRDASHFEGALTVARGAGVARLGDDPFARIFPARVLRVDAGVLGAVPPPCGPTIERYGSAQPWPWDRYDAAA